MPWFSISRTIQASYLEFLQNDLVPVLAVILPNENDPNVPDNTLWFQQDGAPPHYTRSYFIRVHDTSNMFVKMSEQRPSHVTVERWISNFTELTLNGSELHCLVCGSIPTWHIKTDVFQHVATYKHRARGCMQLKQFKK
ncbi:hypothetical protein NQ318_013876 [Aromia moschata]|uniref:Uncharacterized protein n=1 Tax=Aromia moschata TaxID=1265417 RepID=A0AAV8ZBD0_9CUCU|nr:hypothetical protein NQ318_013876 [Aromia moschata]